MSGALVSGLVLLGVQHIASGGDIVSTITILGAAYIIGGAFIEK
jgi:hypothetical protein